MTEFTDLSTSDTEPSYLMRLDRENGDAIWVPIGDSPLSLVQDGAKIPFKLNLESDEIHWVQLSPEDLQKSDFLDRRILKTLKPNYVEVTSSQFPGIDKLNDYIWVFHFGHCGSTSFSRALSQFLDLPAYREPGAMWSLFREFSLNQTLSTEQTYLGQKLIDTMSSTFGTALIKPSSLHTEFLVKHIVKPHQSRAVFLINNWKSCVLNGLKKIQNGELPEGDYQPYERYSWQLWEHDRPLKNKVAKFQNKTNSAAATLLIGWLGKVHTLSTAWEQLRGECPRVLARFENYLDSPEQEMSRIAKSLNISRKFKGPLSIGSLGKGSQSFEREAFQAQLNLTEKKVQSSIMRL